MARHLAGLITLHYSRSRFAHMSALNRRFFVKTLLAGAASAAPACAALHKRIAFPATATNGNHFKPTDDSASLNIDAGNQQLRITPVGSPLSFQNFLRVGSEWKPATLAGVPFVTGASFPLITERIKRNGSSIRCEGSAEAEGFDGKNLHYDWNAEVSALAGEQFFPWMRIRTMLRLPAPLKLQQKSGVEPQLITWLSSNSTLMEGQSGSWRRVLLSQPTRNSLGTTGNGRHGLDVC